MTAPTPKQCWKGCEFNRRQERKIDELQRALTEAHSRIAAQQAIIDRAKERSVANSPRERAEQLFRKDRA